jgi:hypothetical protein
LSLPGITYPGPPAVKGFYAALLQSLAAMPGVESVGAVSTLPFTDLNDREMAFAARGMRLAECSATITPVHWRQLHLCNLSSA